jgi:hypothetical protein
MRQTSAALFHIMSASLLERMRRTSFLLITGLTVYVAYLLVPPLDANYLTMTLANRRGIYNSAWVGTMFGMVASLLLSLFAFYLVKGAVNMDRATRVGRIIATTPTSGPLYILGKWLSNLAILVIILAVLTVMALMMQLIRAEDRAIDFVALAAPIWLMGLPVAATVAALAILFECITFLRDGFGNVVYFFLWVFMLTGLISNLGNNKATVPDFFGISRPLANMQAVMSAEDPAYNGDFGIGRSGFTQPVQTFVWNGIDWKIPAVLDRLRWLLLSLGIVLVATLPFDRFDPTRERQSPTPKQDQQPHPIEEIPQAQPGEKLAHSRLEVSWTAGPSTGAHRLGGRGVDGILLAELRLALKGQPWWWYGVAGILIVAGLTASPASTLRTVLPFAWIWPILIWSQLGVREEKYFTNKIVFSAPRPIRRQLPTTWGAGVIVALVAGSGVAIRLLAAAEWGHLMAWGIAALFIPSLALALGTWSKTSRLFEIVYLVWWYMAVNGGPSLDFMGTSGAALVMGTPLKYLGLTIILICMAVFGRWQQIQN